MMALLNRTRNALKIMVSWSVNNTKKWRSFSGQADVVTQSAVHDGILTIRINRPEKLNAISISMVRSITNHLKEANEDEHVKTVMLTSTGKFFSAGDDLSALAELKLSSKQLMESTSEPRNTFTTFFDSLIDLKKPMVAAVNGPAVGLLVTCLPLCDIVWATQDATFLTPLSANAFSPLGVSSRTFPAALGPSLANEMLMFNRKITADEALKTGFVSSLFPKDNFLENAQNKLREILSVSSPESMMAAKSLIRTEAYRAQLRAASREEAEIYVQRWLSPEFTAFLKQFVSRSSRSPK
ncbi:Enoyl-CoA delta isomerase 2 [Halotydeus destructor]|nr:Enoyl-CoA delta isomerase 2 [Halotydeus destructor]